MQGVAVFLIFVCKTSTRHKVLVWWTETRQVLAPQLVVAGNKEDKKTRRRSEGANEDWREAWEEDTEVARKAGAEVAREAGPEVAMKAAGYFTNYATCPWLSLL